MEKPIRPTEIENTSMQIIASELTARGIVLPDEHAAIVKRVIHTTADFDYAENLSFTPRAVERAVEALRTGVPIITDTNMAKAGISSVGLKKLNTNVYCFMAEPEIALKAKEKGCTRAAVSMEKAAAFYPQAIIASGNAPTALFALKKQIEQGYRPSLVIGVPVGFVNVVEAKEEIYRCCEAYDIPAIVAFGRKGGSNVAAAICNALIYLAGDLLNPENRGWN